jgi:hypothetical protein
MAVTFYKTQFNLTLPGVTAAQVNAAMDPPGPVPTTAQIEDGTYRGVGTAGYQDFLNAVIAELSPTGFPALQLSEELRTQAMVVEHA